MLLLGRVAERLTLDDLVQRAKAGRGGVVVVHGVAGCGKTALVEDLVDRAEGVRRARVVGMEAEANLGYAGLHRLLLPFLDGLAGLPGPQRESLDSAFGLRAGPPADLFRVGLATLTLLSAVANEEPLLCVIDDAQWVDGDSLEALAFVGRRLDADRIAVVFTMRDGERRLRALDGFERLELGGLDHTDATALLHDVAPEVLVDPGVASRIVGATGGNPLALIELARELSAEELTGGGLLPDALPLGQRLEEHFTRRVGTLPAQTQLFLLALAADPTADASLLWFAAESLGIGDGAFEAIRDSGLVVERPRLRFRHPIIRAAVYGAAPEPARRRVHSALAGAADAVGDHDRRVWHRAAAALRPDEDLATDLEASADRSRARGSQGAAIRSLLRAAELTPDRTVAAGRLFRASQVAGWAGATDLGEALVRRSLLGLTDPLEQAHAEWFRAFYYLPHQRFADAPAELASAAGTLAPLDVRLARDAALDALQAAGWACHLSRGPDVAELATAARALPLPVEEPAAGGAGVGPSPTDPLLDGMAAAALGEIDAAVPLLRLAVGEWRDAPLDPERLIRWSRMVYGATRELWDAEAMERWAARALAGAREHNSLIALHLALFIGTTVDCQLGRIADAEAHLDELHDLAVTWRVIAPFGDAAWTDVEVAAWRGRDDATRAAVRRLETSWADQAFGLGVAHGQLSLALLELSKGRYAEALTAARRAREWGTFELRSRALPEIVVAAARTGDLDVARAAADELGELVSATGSAWALGVHARCRALVATGDDADAAYRESIEVLDGTVARADLARSRLVYGEWLRRERRRLEARRELRAAHELLVAIGADGFAGRARAELAATGEKVRKRSVDTERELTPRESQVARMAARGSTNGEIAAAIFVSPYTVDHHLRKVFRKLGITSRRSLADALAVLG